MSLNSSKDNDFYKYWLSMPQKSLSTYWRYTSQIIIIITIIVTAPKAVFNILAISINLICEDIQDLSED